MGTRLELQTALEAALGSDYVYYQPPESLKLSYPCIKYKVDDVSRMAADNKAYRFIKKYQLIVISRDPDDPVIMKLLKWQHCSYERQYTSDNLYHDVLTLYY